MTENMIQSTCEYPLWYYSHIEKAGAIMEIMEGEEDCVRGWWMFKWGNAHM